MLVTLLGMVMDVRPLHPSKAEVPMLVTLLGMVMDVREVHEPKALLSILVSPVKYCNSSNEVIFVPINTVPKLVTSAASDSLSSPSPLVSQWTTQLAFTLASAKMMMGLGGAISIIVLNSFQ